MDDGRAFEFFMIFYGLLLGLAVTELFGGFGALLREKKFPSFGCLTPMLAAVVLIEIIANFVDAWDLLQNVRISFGYMARPTMIGITYFALATILVPRDPAEWNDLDNYFMDHRRRFAGLLILCNILVAIPEVSVELAVFGRGDLRELMLYVGGNVWLFGSYALLFFGRSRASAIVSMASALAYYGIYYMEDLPSFFAYPATA